MNLVQPEHDVNIVTYISRRPDEDAEAHVKRLQAHLVRKDTDLYEATTEIYWLRGKFDLAFHDNEIYKKRLEEQKNSESTLKNAYGAVRAMLDETREEVARVKSLLARPFEPFVPRLPPPPPPAASSASLSAQPIGYQVEGEGVIRHPLPGIHSLL